MRIRASLGTLVVAGLEDARVDALPTIGYVMLDSNHGCNGTCAFCPQSRVADSSKELLSRITWPETDLETLATSLASAGIKRVCVQTVIKKSFMSETKEVVKTLHEYGLNASVSITPIPLRHLKELRDLGADYLGVGLDAASPRVSRAVGKPYPWNRYWEFIKDGVTVFGEGHVVTHIIVGLGETPKELLEAIEKARDLGSEVSLFAFTPVRGTPMYGTRSPPSIRYYRFAQLATHLIMKGEDWRSFTVFRHGLPYIRPEYLDLKRVDEVVRCVTVRGCPGCNRPFYNESPRTPIFNYPSSGAALRNINTILKEIEAIILKH